MTDIKDLFQSADWKTEKHVPVIDVPGKVKKGVFTPVSIMIGKEIPHPNTTAHHIRWIEVYFLPQGETFPYELGRAEFSSHGESVQGPDTSTIYTHSEMFLKFKTDKPGTLLASSYCNIHGLWKSSKEIAVE
ncbi:MAG: class II SORL domain-containing protein [Candidatus Omnitrophica bacterium]|nr:class II SORL domain-containing protein [Candidatus Omnitrophota bacterium]MDD5552254.1 class II SORL domain-containing protein [Candidatus Omnitrophota bacterium]